MLNVSELQRVCENGVEDDGEDVEESIERKGDAREGREKERGRGRGGGGQGRQATHSFIRDANKVDLDHHLCSAKITAAEGVEAPRSEAVLNADEVWELQRAGEGGLTGSLHENKQQLLILVSSSSTQATDALSS